MAAATEILVTFPGGKRVDAQVGQHVVRTDQPIDKGGEDSAPPPFSLFLASLGTCAGIYVLGFCQTRGLPTEGIQVRQRVHTDPETHQLSSIDLDIEVPPDFPARYHEALVRVAEQCAVKKAIAAQPHIAVQTVVTAATAA